jgi:hypothetical protein
LSGQTKSDSTTTAHSTFAAAKYYNVTRRHAIDLYKAFKEKFHDTGACACDVCHTTHLRLDPWVPQKRERQKDNLRFNVFLTTTSNWKEMELEPLDGDSGSELCEMEEINLSVSDCDSPKVAVTEDVSRSALVQASVGIGSSVSGTKIGHEVNTMAR